jgi:hypothetical protein
MKVPRQYTLVLLVKVVRLNVYKFGPYRKENISRLYYKAQQINAV